MPMASPATPAMGPPFRVSQPRTGMPIRISSRGNGPSTRVKNTSGPAAAQARDALGQVVLRIERVSVHARDEGAARVGQADVEPHWRAAARVLEDAHALVLALQLAQDLSRPII